MSHAGWLAIAQQAAQEAAHTEAQQAWQRTLARTLPFAHRWAHIQEVVRLARWLAAETGADVDVVEAAAWLHDVCKMQKDHAKRGAEEAERLLQTSDFPAEKVIAVVNAISQHEGMTRPPGAPPLQPLEAAVLWDADKLSKLGVQAITYMLSTHYLAGKGLVERLAECQSHVAGTLLRTVESMNTAPARALAEERYQHMCQFLEVWQAEVST
jgi:uncharacterized protein